MGKKFFDRVYEAVRQVPEGKVVTYGQLAGIVGTKDARKVGWALHANKDPETPCHRVVNKEGRLAPNFGAFLPSIHRSSRRVRTEPKSREGRLGGDGPDEQRRRLISEGVEFVDKMHANLEACQWQGELT